MTNDTIRTWAEIDTKALIHNLNLAKKLSGKKVMCVIKGDAHGHGAPECARVFEDNGADAFAVACLSEGIALRESGITLPILLLGWTPAEYADKLAEYNLTQSILDEEYALQLNQEAERINKILDVHIKLDTGMSRTGINAQADPISAAETVLRISNLKNLNISGIFTHCAAADMPEKDSYTAWQLDNYLTALKELENRGFNKSVVHHASNSACIMYHPEAHFDMVRMGVMMYGLYPDGNITPDGPLAPVLSLKTRVVQIKEFDAGAYISYGCTYKTDRPTKIAAVAAGYADAYPRLLSNKGAYAVINGVKCPQVGRICMDMCMFDVTDADAKRGDEVILYGKGGMPMEMVAQLTESINCESLSLITNRVKKIYLE